MVKTGRPKKDGSKKNQYRLRMDDAEVEKLEYLSKVTGMTKAEVIRKGIDIVFKEVTNDD